MQSSQHSSQPVVFHSAFSKQGFPQQRSLYLQTRDFQPEHFLSDLAVLPLQNFQLPQLSSKDSKSSPQAPDLLLQALFSTRCIPDKGHFCTLSECKMNFLQNFSIHSPELGASLTGINSGIWLLQPKLQSFKVSNYDLQIPRRRPRRRSSRIDLTITKPAVHFEQLSINGLRSLRIFSDLRRRTPPSASFKTLTSRRVLSPLSPAQNSIHSICFGPPK